MKEEELGKTADVEARYRHRTQAVVIPAITSCTNTSNPSVMIGAGLVAQKPSRRG
ncbi:MAG: hypothetical protein IPM76_18445 [Chloroflexi bacterium]|nr:hypothetical protein [Chloroflexota bacterium]